MREGFNSDDFIVPLLPFPNNGIDLTQRHGGAEIRQVYDGLPCGFRFTRLVKNRSILFSSQTLLDPAKCPYFRGFLCVRTPTGNLNRTNTPTCLHSVFAKRLLLFYAPVPPPYGTISPLPSYPSPRPHRSCSRRRG